LWFGLTSAFIEDEPQIPAPGAKPAKKTKAREHFTSCPVLHDPLKLYIAMKSTRTKAKLPIPERADDEPLPTKPARNAPPSKRKLPEPSDEDPEPQPKKKAKTVKPAAPGPSKSRKVRSDVEEQCREEEAPIKTVKPRKRPRVDAPAAGEEQDPIADLQPTKRLDKEKKETVSRKRKKVEIEDQSAEEKLSTSQTSDGWVDSTRPRGLN
jgi:hypothetical protein